jgi:F0F1-type ATP synthase assembly protein I
MLAACGAHVRGGSPTRIRTLSLRLDSDAAARPDGLGGYRRALLSGVDHASIMSMELLAAILTWTGLGWLADRALGTGPWLLVAGGLIGNAAGLYLIYLRGKRMDAADAARAEEARTADAARGGAGVG